eukprot:CAMPEP_0174827680 /NCGR_PEP_ID=MMETSP1114-20130205/872_1 /TAXON_ID=312471 /ORGANISM="Neobodo designis, Strain CCAP 1951/1" /LENGTH=78 /DNA_ID=CAMNT_0016061355 /DNA_START=56 /DNA_END=292 /DNA_ORIENTATION=-
MCWIDAQRVRPRAKTSRRGTTYTSFEGAAVLGGTAPATAAAAVPGAGGGGGAENSVVPEGAVANVDGAASYPSRPLVE